MEKNKVFYNAVINEDLFFAIYDYIRFNPDCARQYHIFSISDLDKLSLEDWKDLAGDTIYWLEHIQFPNIYVLKDDDNSPGIDTWGTLYYQTLSYMGHKKIYGKTIRQMELDEIVKQCRDCIENAKNLRDEIRPLNDNDLNNI